MITDRTGCLRPCPSCGADVLHALTGDGPSERWFTLDPQSGTEGKRWVARGSRQTTMDPWRLIVVRTLGAGYAVHGCQIPRKTAQDGPCSTQS